MFNCVSKFDKVCFHKYIILLLWSIGYSQLPNLTPVFWSNDINIRLRQNLLEQKLCVTTEMQVKERPQYVLKIRIPIYIMDKSFQQKVEMVYIKRSNLSHVVITLRSECSIPIPFIQKKNHTHEIFVMLYFCEVLLILGLQLYNFK